MAAESRNCFKEAEMNANDADRSVRIHLSSRLTTTKALGASSRMELSCAVEHFRHLRSSAAKSVPFALLSAASAVICGSSSIAR
jgi:hypothetical protein